MLRIIFPEIILPTVVILIFGDIKLFWVLLQISIPHKNGFYEIFSLNRKNNREFRKLGICF